jgi:hypothetical protein
LSKVLCFTFNGIYVTIIKNVPTAAVLDFYEVMDFKIWWQIVSINMNNRTSLRLTSGTTFYPKTTIYTNIILQNIVNVFQYTFQIWILVS